jgi:hypothetical protein
MFLCVTLHSDHAADLYKCRNTATRPQSGICVQRDIDASHVRGIGRTTRETATSGIDKDEAKMLGQYAVFTVAACP